MWLDRLPASVAFCDVETTGLGNRDRIVSFGGIGMISRDLAKGRPDLAYLYLVFDPGRNHGNAEQIHGFSDSTLRLQNPFAVHAADVWRFLTSYELLVAHNAAFDLRFINREMRLSGPARSAPRHSSRCRDCLLCCRVGRLACADGRRYARALERSTDDPQAAGGAGPGKMDRCNRGRARQARAGAAAMNHRHTAPGPQRVMAAR
jgi:DNA polymerase III epsilon subunit-like protein